MGLSYIASPMRGHLRPGKRPIPTEPQTRFTTLSRHRRTKLAKAAGTTLVKADQWAHGRSVPDGVAEALENQLDKLPKPKK